MERSDLFIVLFSGSVIGSISLVLLLYRCCCKRKNSLETQTILNPQSSDVEEDSTSTLNQQPRVVEGNSLSISQQFRDNSLSIRDDLPKHDPPPEYESPPPYEIAIKQRN
jgi:hypothetical protein